MKQLWQNSETIINGWLSIGNNFSAEIMAKQGWDSICVDAQHGMLDFNDAVGMVQAINTTDVFPLVRIPWLRPEVIGKYLDAGFMGIICPMINTAEDVKNFVKYSNYPPDGERSFGPSRIIFGNPDYFNYANKNIVRLAMIETVQAIDNLTEICQVKGIDGFYIGPADLSLSHGFNPAFDREEEEMINLIKNIIKVAKDNNKKIGLHTASVAYAKRAIKWGIDMVTISNDVRLLATAARGVLNEVKS